MNECKKDVINKVCFFFLKTKEEEEGNITFFMFMNQG